MGVESFACYVSDDALSIDNVFVILFIASSFALPQIAQKKVPLFGIVLALAKYRTKIRLDAEAAADDFLHDFGRAAVDRLHPCIEIRTRNWVFTHVAVATV
jgi:hypothetical protein